MILTPLFWAQWFAVLAVEATLVTVAAALIARRLKSANRQRAIWQGAALGLLMLATCEVTGVSRALAGLVKASTESRQTVKVIVRTFSPTIRTPAISEREEPINPQPKTASVEAPGRSVWWPAVLWLTGFVVIVARTAFARVLFLLIGKRRQTASVEALLPPLQTIAQQLGLHRRVRLLESERLSSPIVFGVFRPAICLPARFSQEFNIPHREAILAHELAHVAAHDPAWYCLADVITALWWWHPLAWWSRRQLHASSESAADEASLLVNDGPGALAECLVELGRRLTRTRSFGWLSIEGKEFQSGLGRRVTRLLSLSGGQWREARPRLWLAVCVGFFMVLLFVSAGAAWNSRSPERSSVGESWRDSIASLAWKSLVGPNQPILLAQAEPKPAVPLPLPDRGGLADQPTGAPMPRIPERHRATHEKLDRIILDEVAFDGTPFSEVVSNLSARARERDPEGKGVNVIINDWPTNHPLRIQDQRIRVQPALKNVSLRTALNAVVADGPIKWSVLQYAILFTPKHLVRDDALYTRLFKVDSNTMVKALDESLKGVFTLTSATGSTSTSEQRLDAPFHERLRRFLEISGVDMNLPKSAWYLEGLGLLTVRATLQDLDVVEERIQALNKAPPQLSIEVKFVEISENEQSGLDFLQLIGTTPAVAFAAGDAEAPAATTTLPPRSSISTGRNRGKDGLVSSPQSSNLPPAAFTGVLTDPQYRVVVRALEESKGVDILSTPGVTTLSGRQAQIKVVDVKYIVTNLDRGANGTPQPITEPIEFGRVLDVVPYVLADGYTIQMTIIPTVKEFLGYDVEAGKKFTTGAPGEETLMPLPLVRIRQVVSSATVWDGQTVVVGAGNVEAQDEPKRGATSPPKRVRKSLFVLVTPTIIDAAGNPVHGPEDFPLRSKSVPPQKPAR